MKAESRQILQKLATRLTFVCCVELSDFLILVCDIFTLS